LVDRSDPESFSLAVSFEALVREEAMLRRFLQFDNLTKLTALLIFGGFYLGVGAVGLALLLGFLLFFSTRALWDPWVLALTQRRNVLNEFAWPLLISVVYGIAELINGIIFQGYDKVYALKILLFNVNPVYVFLGVYVGFRHPGFMRKFVQFSAWQMVVYAPLYFLVLNKIHFTVGDPDSGFSFLGNPGTGSVPLIGLIAYETHLGQYWAPILVLSCLTIANQERADWLGLILALMVWGWLAGQIRRVFTILGTITVVLIIAALIDLKLPPIPGRGGELSARGTISRLAGSISPELAEQVSENRGDASFYYGTVYWRKRWWAAIREEISKDPMTITFGFGYGYPLAKLAGEGTLAQGTRSPHSIFYFTLAYSGAVGVTIFFWLEFTIARLLYRVYKETGQIYGLAIWIYQFSGAFFGNFLETPSGILFYMTVGLCVGPMMLHLEQERHAERNQFAAPYEVAELV
jgi:O-Antigen ligase